MGEENLKCCQMELDFSVEKLLFCLVLFSGFTLTGESLLLPIRMAFNPIHVLFL